MREYRHHIKSDKSVVLIFNDGVIPVHEKNSNYKDVLKALNEHKYGDLVNLVDKGSIINNCKAVNKDFRVEDGVVYFKDGSPVPRAVSVKLIEFAKSGVNIAPLVKFWDNLRRNPSQRSRDELYSFLEKNKIPLTEDGCFICYKAVDKNYMDKHTGTFNNRPGEVVSIPWEKVDPDARRTCSYGLHVAAWNYAKSFGSWTKGEDSDKLVEVKVNPRHVVSVPEEAGSEKVRVCQYVVLHPAKDEVQELVYTYRTYYYKGDRRKDRPFNPRQVTSHKPHRFGQTCRAKTLEEAIKEFKGWYNEVLSK